MNTVPPANPNLPSANIDNLQNSPVSNANSNQKASSPEQVAYFASLVASGQGSSGSSADGQGGSTGQQSGANNAGNSNTMINASNINTSSILGNANLANNVANVPPLSELPEPNLKKQLAPINISVPQVSDSVAAALMNIQNMQPASVQQAVVTASAVDTSAMISQIATQVANQILVSAPNSNQGPQMVTVVLNDNVLPSTQINIQRDSFGTLNVMFNTQNASSAQVLNGLQNTIQTSLSNNLGQVNVGVSITNTASFTIVSSNNNSNSGQGAPFSGFEGDAGQGRSRGEYIPQEELPN
jgi:hypothetical protein